jgi:SAM-dependent methyltransferase
MLTGARSPTVSLLANSAQSVVSHPADVKRVLARTGGAIVHLSENCAIVRHGGHRPAGEFADRDVMRCMDVFELILPRDGAMREQTLREFFEYLHGSYESFIETERNLQNIETLLSLVVPPGGVQLPVLDFGCGTGLSAVVADRRAVEVVGMDICSGMRSLAEERGLKTLAAEEISELPAESFAGGIASYVLHLDPRPVCLGEVWRCIKQGGSFAANFHKGIGVTEFFLYAEELGMRPTLIDDSSQTGRHGPYICCKKNL